MQRHRPQGVTRKRRLGVLVDSLETVYQRDLLHGLAEAAERAGATLWCFLGGCLPDPAHITDVQHSVYDLAGPLNSDALILCSGTFVHHVGLAGLVAHCERYKPLPLCSIGVQLPGHTSVLVDNQIGMRRIVDHLIVEHGLRRIAFVRGPLASEEAESRLEAYRQTLARHKIAFDEQIVATGDFMETGGYEAVRQFANTHGPRFSEIEAVVASNDNMAIGVMNALHERHIVVPRDMKVTGFDDIEEACLTQPQLSTVRQPLSKLGHAAVRLMLEQVQLGTTEPLVCLETELIPRRSCGCGNAARFAKCSSPPPGNFSFEAGVVFRRERILDAMTRAAKGGLGAAGTDWQGRLLSALLHDLRAGDPDAFPRTVQDLLDRLATRGVDLTTCRLVFDAMREKLLPALRSDHDARDCAENLLHDASRAIDDMILRHVQRQQLRLAYSARMSANVCAYLSLCFDRTKLVKTFHESLPRAGVQAAFLVLYLSDAHQAELLTGFDERSGRRILGGARFDRQCLVPSDYDLDSAGGCHVVMPLFVDMRLYGHLVLKLDLDAGFAFRAIATALSCALHGAELKNTPQPAADARPQQSDR